MESTGTRLRDSGRWAMGATAERIWKAAEKLAERLQDGSALTSHTLRKAMNEVSDASYAGHQWNWRDAYDAAEVAVNLRVLAATNRAKSAAEGGRRAIEAALGLARLETPQTQRAQATDGLQQFSTPIEIAVAVIEAARIRAGDTVVEPSAGTGVLATLAAAHLDEAHGGRLRVNEIDPQRAMLLRRMFRDDMVSEKDAETLRETDANPQPSVIVMNPPFTTRRANGKMRRHADLTHLAAACRMVAPDGGRVVAVTSCNSEPGNEHWSKAFDGMEPAPAVRASIVIDGSMFRSRGTNARTRLTIVDIGDEAAGPMVSGTAEDGASLRAMVGEIAAERRAA